MKNNSTESFVQNRIINKKLQFKIWLRRWESGMIRYLERKLIGVNISDRLGGDGSSISHLYEISDQFIKSWQLEEANDKSESPVKGIKLSEATVEINHGLIRLRNGFILDDFLPHWQSLIYGGGLISEYRTTNKKKPRLQGEWTSVSNTPFYYHFLIEDLARIARIRKDFPDIKVAIYKNQETWKYDLLRYFKFNFQEIEHESITFEYYVTSSGGGHQNIAGVKILRDFNTTEDICSERKVNILIDRKGLSRENSEIEKFVTEILQPKGYILINPDILSISEQISLFRSAANVVGVHGGALANLIWCSQITKITEIQIHPYRTNDFEYLAKKLNMNYAVLKGEQNIEDFKKRILESF